MSDLHLPFRAHAMLWPCCSSQGHGTAWPSRDGLWATCLHLASSGYHTEFHEDYKHTNLRCRWPEWNQTTFVMDEEKSGSSTLQKNDLLNYWTSSSDIFGYRADFHEGHGTIGALQVRGTGTACYVWIGLNSVQQRVLPWAVTGAHPKIFIGGMGLNLMLYISYSWF